MIYGYASGRHLDAQKKQLRVAGAKRVFEQLDAALENLFEGDTLLVTRVDRVAGSMRDLLDKLKKIDERTTKRRGVFRSLGDGETWADTTTADWRFTLSALEWVANIERELVRARIREGHEQAKARGVKIGRKPKLTPQQKREAIKRRDGGDESCREIAASYNVSAATISRLTV